MSPALTDTANDARQTIQLRTAEIVHQFRKIGLLIDDQSDAGDRLARELYGSERLPRWWLHLRDAEDACEALMIRDMLLRRAHDEGGPDPLPDGTVLVVDRYLPAQAGLRPIPLDAPLLVTGGERNLQQLHKILCGLNAGPADSRVHTLFVTSYPYASSTATPEGRSPDCTQLPWRRRTSNAFQELRSRLSPALLRYGPLKTVPAPSGDSNGRVELLGSLAEALAQRTGKQLSDPPEVVLITGGGSNLSQGSYGPGLPPIWWLVEEACRLAAGEAPREAPRKVEPPHPSHNRGGVLDSFEEFRRAMARDSSELPGYRLKMESFFLPSQPRIEWERLQTVLRRFDHGFPYQTWLAARLPWSCWICANQDRAVERAANALVDAQDRHAVDVTRWNPARSARNLTRHWAFGPEGGADLDRSRLFRPCGTLADPRTGANDLESPREKVARDIRHIAEVIGDLPGDPLWLVVVGSRLDDFPLQDLVEKLLKDRRHGIIPIWIDPFASWHLDPQQLSSTSRVWLDLLMSAHHSSGGLAGDPWGNTFRLLTKIFADPSNLAVRLNLPEIYDSLPIAADTEATLSALRRRYGRPDQLSQLHRLLHRVERLAPEARAQIQRLSLSLPAPSVPLNLKGGALETSALDFFFDLTIEFEDRLKELTSHR